MTGSLNGHMPPGGRRTFCERRRLAGFGRCDERGTALSQSERECRVSGRDIRVIPLVSAALVLCVRGQGEADEGEAGVSSEQATTSARLQTDTRDEYLHLPSGSALLRRSSPIPPTGSRPLPPLLRFSRLSPPRLHPWYAGFQLTSFRRCASSLSRFRFSRKQAVHGDLVRSSRLSPSYSSS